MDYFDRKKRFAGGGPNFWMTDTISYSEVLAAYRFKGAASADSALTNLVKAATYKLTNSGCGWSSGNGFNVSIETWGNTLNNAGHYLDNSSLRSAGIKTMIIKIASANINRALPLTTFGGMSAWLNMPVAYATFAYGDYSQGFGIAHQNGTSSMYNGGSSGLAMDLVRESGANYSDGVIGINLNNAGTETAYKNGTAINLSVATSATWSKDGDHRWSGFIAANVPRLIGGFQNSTADPGAHWANVTNHSFVGSYNVLAMACYSRLLSQTEHQNICRLMQAV